MNNLVSENIQEFVKLGFTKLEASIYLSIYKSGTTSALELAKKLNASPNSLYRSLEKLTQKNILSSSNNWPKTYKAISPRFAFDLMVKNKIIEIEESKEKLISLLPTSNSNDQTKIEIVGGSKELFDNYVKLSQNTKKEILIISIGEEVSEEVLLANRDCLQRGIKIRFIAHKLDQTNKNLLIRWQRMGMEVKHLPGQGFHLVIFDQNQTLLSASNPKIPDQRTTIHIYSPEISKSMSDYFFSIWDQATPIS